ncbi:leucine-rich repeat domain-containing protein [Microcoleus vaginatus ZQ-A3]|uniref:leucine-rich repeat domain-containing protein n=3 Tax=Microcoleus TaxID=44471 RepID=UPI001688E2D5|nr:leucine-rich repeat domain-containing protein [Microcoleus sp. FACHB-45]
MSEPQANQPINFSSFADRCTHKDSLSKSARDTVEVLLKRARTSKCNKAARILSNLTELSLDGNQITDITPLSALTNLTSLYLNNNQITDITPLSALTNLTSLYLNNNKITDITGLSALTNLTHLYLNNNPITDITGLSALTNLTHLYLNNYQITDITPLSALTNLTSLYLNNNQITDITPLSALINLTSLYLNNNQITDITPLSALTNLTSLYLNNNKITDITGLSALTNLTDLNLYCNQITDITSLSALISLTSLRLFSNEITDIAPLSALINLKGLSLHCNPIIGLNLSIEFTQKYLTLFTAPIDYEKATETVKKIYAAIDREAPKVIVSSSLPATLTLLKQLHNDCIAQHQISPIATGNSGWGNSLLNELYQSVDVGNLSPVLWEALFDQIILDPDAEPILQTEFNQLVENYRESQAVDFLSDYNYLQPLTSKDLLKQIHLTEFFISKCGFTLDLKAQELFHCKQQLFEECGWILPFEKICIICDRPLHIRFDAENRLHAEGEPAIAFADGYSLYFHHGVKLPEKYGKVHPDRWQPEWLLSEENAELRRLLIQRIGYDRICQELAVTELDSWQEYTLLTHIPHPDCHMGCGWAAVRESCSGRPKSLSTNA